MTFGYEPNTPIPEPKLCGIGHAGACCIYLSAGPEGICCEARTEIGRLLELRSDAGQMNASRRPKGIFPKCQLTIEDLED